MMWRKRRRRRGGGLYGARGDPHHMQGLHSAPHLTRFPSLSFVTGEDLWTFPRLGNRHGLQLRAQLAMMMKGVLPLRLKLQQQHPQTHASASVSTTPRAKLRLSGARRSCSLHPKDHLQASWISRAGTATARFPAGGPPRLYERASGAKSRLAAQPRVSGSRFTKKYRSTLVH